MKITSQAIFHTPKILVGVWYIMWDNIGKVKENKKDMEFLPSARRDSINSATGAPENEALLVYADCHSTTKGLFAGKVEQTYCLIAPNLELSLAKYSFNNVTIIFSINSSIGLILFAFSTTGFIVFLVLSESPDCKHQELAVKLNDGIEIIILLVMIGVSFYVSLLKNNGTFYLSILT